MKAQLLGSKSNPSQPHSHRFIPLRHITSNSSLPTRCATRQPTPTPAPTKSKPPASSAPSLLSPQCCTPPKRQKSLSSSPVQHALLDSVSRSLIPIKSLHRQRHKLFIKYQLNQCNKSPAQDHGEHHFQSRMAARPRRDWSIGRGRGGRLCIIGFLLLLQCHRLLLLHLQLLRRQL